MDPSLRYRDMSGRRSVGELSARDVLLQSSVQWLRQSETKARGSSDARKSLPPDKAPGEGFEGVTRQV